MTFTYFRVNVWFCYVRHGFRIFGVAVIACNKVSRPSRFDVSYDTITVVISLYDSRVTIEAFGGPTHTAWNWIWDNNNRYSTGEVVGLSSIVHIIEFDFIVREYRAVQAFSQSSSRR